jgi:hypothetical protein
MVMVYLSVEERRCGVNNRVNWDLGLVCLSESTMGSDIGDNGEVEIVAGAWMGLKKAVGFGLSYFGVRMVPLEYINVNLSTKGTTR